MKRLITTQMLLAIGMMATAQVKTPVSEFNLAGPYAVSAPFAIDTVDVQGKKFDPVSQLGSIALTSHFTGKFSGQVLPSLPDSKSVGLLSFYVNNSDFIKGKIEVKGPKHSKLFIDGVEAGGELKLAPEHHTFTIQYLAEPKDTDSIQVVFDTPTSITYQLTPNHPYMVHDLTDGKRVRGVNLSADGQFVCVSYQTTDRGGNTRWNYELRDVKSGRLISQPSRNPRWMPKSIAWLEEEKEGSHRVLYKVDPKTGVRTRFAYDIPEGSYTVAPTEDYLIFTLEEEGPQEDKEVFEILEMDDRQPGWRKRSYLAKYDIKTGMTQRITFGNKGEYLYDISQDGSKLLVISNRSRLTKRPTTVSDVFVMDAQTLKVDTLLSGAEFLGSGSFSPDGSQVLFVGNPEAFNRIGCQLPAEVTPSMTENELFLFDIASKQVKPLTKDFDPSINDVDWSWTDGQIYFSAEDRDYVNMFVLNPNTGNVAKLPVKGDYTYRFNMAAHAPVLAYLSYKTMEPASAYVATIKNAKFNAHSIMFNGKEALGDAEIGTCQDWNFTNSKGDTVYGRLYLPKDFDATKKYPMIVYYYGGCSPVSRYFESPYAPQYWNSLGYVAYILEPSGATGFGQEWASRHVNTAGRGPAEDIIEGTKKICVAHPFINKDKIGCMGASYGGFMTQYLQTQTDIFAAAVSHAGIANHTSYWGEGYWGYNYSEVSMANSYPWSHRQLYVDQSPLFNADKIHTPLLLLHGNADTNVPLIESLQMFTALKLLGREVSLVEVEGENHHILDYSKKEKWLATQMAWFQKWLKDDPTWWDALYPKKHL
ncbi:Dipeptidyl aminopeptidase/acylaminoacyl peptidase [Xylanibacter ruminicola]|uniref:Dipeptidyl aminopeptidase/acylaminoacyl peptidase n=1 Tax=Xylanibacter ruminicola TaxID=839 RepID=A0A1H4ET55_XYLRU|nr:prolyl oligopeptidase family serine peptidase [Xylanibacter ruminicola]SEA88234.1 Dipeptidyl aminopeptidase/acylaminoacyl peptidase [Xylanibacter ruminicola]